MKTPILIFLLAAIAGCASSPMTPVERTKHEVYTSCIENYEYLDLARSTIRDGRHMVTILQYCRAASRRAVGEFN